MNFVVVYFMKFCGYFYEILWCCMSMNFYGVIYEFSNKKDGSM